MVARYGDVGKQFGAGGPRGSNMLFVTRRLREVRQEKDRVTRRRLELALELEDLTLRREEIKLHRELLRHRA